MKLMPWVVVCWLMLLAASSAVANGATEEVERTVSGPYEIMVGVLPVPPKQGFVHLTVALTQKDTSSPVTDAEVLARVRPEGETRRSVARLLNSPGSPLYYDRNVEFSKAGTWIVTIEVTKGLGDATISFPLEVEGQPQNLAGRLAWGLVTGAIILGALWVILSIRRAQSRKRASP